MMDRKSIRTYNKAECVSFRITRAEFGGLSNMAPGFPLLVNGIRIRTAEALYQACRFPHRVDVQQLIIREVSPMTAKMRSKPFRDDTRRDWNKIRINVMRWCLRVKLAQNWDAFSELLLRTEDKPIVEESKKDDFWGAKPTNDNTLIGMNVLGRLLMELREAIRTEGQIPLSKVEPPRIPDFLLLGQPIREININTEYKYPQESEQLFDTTFVHEIAIQGSYFNSYFERKVGIPLKRNSSDNRGSQKSMRKDFSSAGDWMQVKDVAEYLNFSKNKVYQLAQQRIIPVSKVGRSWRFEKVVINKWAEERGISVKQNESGTLSV